MPGFRFSVLLCFIAAAAAARILPHWPNFTPTAAIALFGGAHFAPRWKAVLLPLAALALSDLYLGFDAQSAITYPAFIVIALLGSKLGRHPSGLRLAGASLLSSCLFFLITNFALWPPFDLYPKTWAGVMESYAAGLPFFSNTALGDLFYTCALFGAFALLERGIPAVRLSAPATKAVA